MRANLPRFWRISRKANLREDTGGVLGIVSDEYEVVDNRDAFRFLDVLIGSELHFETAGSLWGGRRVWCLARLPEHVELGGDRSATYIYVANSHDGSMAVTAAVTPIRIVCANTLGVALRAGSARGQNTARRSECSSERAGNRISSPPAC